MKFNDKSKPEDIKATLILAKIILKWPLED